MIQGPESASDDESVSGRFEVEHTTTRAAFAALEQGWDPRMVATYRQAETIVKSLPCEASRWLAASANSTQ